MNGYISLSLSLCKKGHLNSSNCFGTNGAPDSPGESCQELLIIIANNSSY